MRLVYYSRYSTLGPSSRYRVFQFEKLYRAAGVDLQVQELFDDQYFDILRSSWSTIRKPSYIASRYSKRCGFAKSLQSANLVVIEHQLFPYAPNAFEKRYLPSRYVLEYDDAIYLKHPRKMPYLMQRSMAVIAGNEELAEYARKFSADVHVVPTVLDTGVFAPSPKSESAKIRIGWSGLEYNFRYLQSLSPVFRKLLERLPVEIVILSGSPPAHFDFPFRFEKWNAQKEAQQINEFDIGVMPLADDAWSRGKCGMKLLQFMALELPSVSSPVGVNRQILQDGVNGFLADSPRAWEERLVQLVQEEGLRRRLGREARKTVEQDFSMQSWFPKILALQAQYAP